MGNQLRENEISIPATRSLRFFQRDGYWYYATREGVDIGPFDSVDDAESGCREYIHFVTSGQVKNPERLMALYRAA